MCLLFSKTIFNNVPVSHSLSFKVVIWNNSFYQASQFCLFTKVKESSDLKKDKRGWDINVQIYG